MDRVIRALALAMVISLIVAGIVAADAFPVPGLRYQPSGPGWRLLTEVRDPSASMAFRVRAATDQVALGALWNELGWNDPLRTGPIGAQLGSMADFHHEIVVLFGVGIGSCTASVQLDSVVIDKSARLVYSVTSERTTCPFLDLSGAVVFVVALGRDVLPTSPFTVQLHAQPTCRSCREPDDRVTL